MTSLLDTMAAAERAQRAFHRAIDQVLPVVRSNLGIGFVPREMLFGEPERTGIFPIALSEPIPPRSIYLFQRKNQPLSIAAKRLQQMLLEPPLQKAVH